MRTAIFLFLLVASQSIFAQMNNDKLETIITRMADSVNGESGRWQFFINEVPFVALTDETNNRMRIISPIIELVQLNDELKVAALTANFHTALDVKYAISQDVLWSAFIHPLRELTEEQVESAINQVYSANITFGTTFSSTSLVFPGSTPDANEEPQKKKPKKVRF